MKKSTRIKSTAAISRWLALWGMASAAASLSAVSSWLGNRYQASLQDLFLPFILTLLTGALVAGMFYRLWRRDRIAGLTAVIAASLVFSSNFEDRIGQIAPVLRALSPLSRLNGFENMWESILLFVLTVVGSYWLGRLASWAAGRIKVPARDVYSGLVAALLLTFALNALPLGLDLAAEWPQFFYHPPQLPAAPTAAKSADKPDIYYIVLDRYANNTVLKDQFGYDNSDFLNWLRDDGYYVNDLAHNNYPYTTMSIASTMMADYDNDIIKRFSGSSEQTIIPFNEAIRNSPVAARLKSIGYRYDLVGNWYETSNLSGLADNTYQQTGQMVFLGHQYTLNNFSKSFLTQSVFWRWLQTGVNIGGLNVFSYQNQGDVDMHHYALNSLRQIADQPAGGKFVYAHILVPHDPYYFNADGSINEDTDTDNVGESVKDKYVNQVKYINSQMRDILTRINQKSDGKAIVVLQADEGPYPTDINMEEFASGEGEVQGGDQTKWPVADLKMKFGNLAAYHVPNANWGTDSDAADSVNIFRLVMNDYFGYQLPYLPDCYYAYPNGRDQPELFANINQKLTDKAADGRCMADGEVKE